MAVRTKKVTSKQWISQIFKAKAAKNGGTVRRKLDSVIKYTSTTALEDEVKTRLPYGSG